MTTVLIIEDTASMREEIAQILEFEGYQSLSAADGNEGVQLARAHHPDMIVCDVMMPQLNGFETVQMIRQDEVLRATPFIFVTALLDAETRQAAQELGVRAYLTKPFASDELLAAIVTALPEQLQQHE